MPLGPGVKISLKSGMRIALLLRPGMINGLFVGINKGVIVLLLVADP